MDNNILNQLSFGFEIEGVFKQGLGKALGDGRFVSDGSVRLETVPWEAEIIPRYSSCEACIHDSNRIVSYCEEHHAIYRREGQVSTEYASNIFKDFPICLEALKKFNKKNHLWNSTCGLHFHVGIKDKPWQLLRAAATNLKFLQYVTGEAKGWCECQKRRLNGSRHFFQDYSNAIELLAASRGNIQKYRIVNFHPIYHTLEFRFLSPCEHKVANIVKLLGLLTSYLGKEEDVNIYTLAETEYKKTDKINIIKSMRPESEKFSIVKKLFPGKVNAYIRTRHVSPSGAKYCYKISDLQLNDRDRIVASSVTSRNVEYLSYSERHEKLSSNKRLFGREQISTSPLDLAFSVENSMARVAGSVARTYLRWSILDN